MIGFMGVWSRYSVIKHPASCRVSNIVDRSVSADNPRLQPESNTRSLLALAILTTVAAGLVWQLAIRNSQYSRFVAEATEEAARHIDDSTNTLKQISDSLVIAKKDNKRVLLQFGARWCTWCNLLHKLFEADDRIRDELNRDYIVVVVDVTDENNSLVNEKYGKPIRFGLPITVILDSGGKELMTQNIAFADEGTLSARIDPNKVLAFLKKWSQEQMTPAPSH
jgi:thiol:disulfide interchange protein